MLRGSAWAARRDRELAMMEESRQRRVEWEEKRARCRAEFAGRIPIMAAEVASEVKATVTAEVTAAVTAALDAAFERRQEAIREALTNALLRPRASSTVTPASSPSDLHALVQIESVTFEKAMSVRTVSAADSISTGESAVGAEHASVAPITCSTVCPGGDPSLPSAAYTPAGMVHEDLQPEVLSSAMGAPPLPAAHNPITFVDARSVADDYCLVTSASSIPLKFVAARSVDDYCLVTNASAVALTQATLSVHNGRTTSKGDGVLPLKLMEMAPFMTKKQNMSTARAPVTCSAQCSGGDKGATVASTVPSATTTSVPSAFVLHEGNNNLAAPGLQPRDKLGCSLPLHLATLTTSTVLLSIALLVELDSGRSDIATVPVPHVLDDTSMTTSADLGSDMPQDAKGRLSTVETQLTINTDRALTLVPVAQQPQGNTILLLPWDPRLQGNPVHKLFSCSFVVEMIKIWMVKSLELQLGPSWEKFLLVFLLVRHTFGNCHNILVPLRILGKGSIRLQDLGALKENRYCNCTRLQFAHTAHSESTCFAWEIAWILVETSCACSEARPPDIHGNCRIIMDMNSRMGLHTTLLHDCLHSGFTGATDSVILLQLQGILHKRLCSAEVQLRCLWKLLTNTTIPATSTIHIRSLQAMVETRSFYCEVLKNGNHQLMTEIFVNVGLLSRVQDAQLFLKLVSSNEQGDTFCESFHSLISVLSAKLQISWDHGGRKSFGFFTQPEAKMRNVAASTYYCGHFVYHDYVFNTIDLDHYLGVFHDQVHIGRAYCIGVFFEQVCAVCYLRLIKVCLDYGTHRNLGDVMKHQVPWDPGILMSQRLEVKPQFKERGMLATFPIIHGLDRVLGLGFFDAKQSSSYIYEGKGYQKLWLGFGRLRPPQLRASFFL